MKKSNLVLGLCLAACGFNAWSDSLTINNKAVGKSGHRYLSSLDYATEGAVRALRRSSEVDFDVLKLSAFMNESANIEQKLDILISEMRKTNQLLANLRKAP